MLARHTYVNMNNYDATCIGSRMRRAAIDRASCMYSGQKLQKLCSSPSPCCAWPVTLTRSRTIYTLSNSPCRQSPSHCLNPSTISPSLTLERYSQSPAIDLPDPQYQLVMSDLHSEADHDKATSSALTHINHYIPSA